MRVHELAKELGVASKDLLAALEEMGFEGRTASSSVPDEAVPRLRASGGKAVPGAKPKAAREEPVAKSRARPRAKPAEEAKAPAKAAASPPSDGGGEVVAPAAAVTPSPAPAQVAAPAAPPAPAKPVLPSLKVVRGS